MNKRTIAAIALLAAIVIIAVAVLALVFVPERPGDDAQAPGPDAAPPDSPEGYVLQVTPPMIATNVGATVTLTASATLDGREIVPGRDGLIWWRLDTSGEHSDGNTDAVYLADDTGQSRTVDVTLPSAGTYYMAAELMVDSGVVAVSYVTITASLPVEPVEAPIYVPFVTDDEDFIRGTDVSSLLAVLESGARFSDWDGESLGVTVDAQGAGFMRLLHDAGVNWVRLRVWNDPYDSQGNGYGGGNCDIEAAKIMGQWATDAGLRVMIDFHYSDFWADPAKQMVPKAWEGMDINEKAAELESFTAESLTTLINAGVDVGMVQIGNETTGGICGETDWANMARLFSAGSGGVRSVSPDIIVAIHFTNPERAGSYEYYASQLNGFNVDYDVFASSYYPYWHGTLENLTGVLTHIAETYGKRVLVAETSWAWTLEDGDGSGNTVAQGSNDADAAYPFSPQGQALEFASVAGAVKAVGDAGMGVFYWENAWIPVRDISGLTGEEKTAGYEENSELWERYGSGWASSYAGEYDPEDAGRWYGGSAVDNQAMFDFTGRPLESLNVFKYITRGTYGYKNEIVSVDVPVLVVDRGGEFDLPEELTVTYADGTGESVSVIWNAVSVGNVDVNTPGSYTVTGSAGDAAVSLTVRVELANMLSNPGFEEEDMSAYSLSGAGIARTGDDPRSGNWSLHFYDTSPVDISASQALSLAPGEYVFSVSAQGGDMGEDPLSYIYVRSGSGQEWRCDFDLSGWQQWQNPSITFTLEEETEVEVGLVVQSAAKSWGTFDDWTLGNR